MEFSLCQTTDLNLVPRIERHRNFCGVPPYRNLPNAGTVGPVLGGPSNAPCRPGVGLGRDHTRPVGVSLTWIEASVMRSSGFPATKITEVKKMIDPTTASS